jgi:hypothetical protein
MDEQELKFWEDCYKAALPVYIKVQGSKWILGSTDAWNVQVAVKNAEAAADWAVTHRRIAMKD